MDQPDVDPVAHRQALAGLARINAISRVVPRLDAAIGAVAKTLPRSVRVLELACGGGDTAEGLVRLACDRVAAWRQKHSTTEPIPPDLGIDYIGVDLSKTAVALTTERLETLLSCWRSRVETLAFVALTTERLETLLASRAEIVGAPARAHESDQARSTAPDRREPGPFTLAAHVVQADVLADPLPEADVVLCSLFVHHLDEPQIVQLLTRMRQSARRRVIIEDLTRSRLGVWLAHVGCRLLSRSPIVHFDGPISVEGALTPKELRDLAAEAGLTEVTITTHWPQRMLMVWDRPH